MQTCILAVHNFAASSPNLHVYAACMLLTAACLVASALQPVCLQAPQMLFSKHAPTEMILSCSAHQCWNVRYIVPTHGSLCCVKLLVTCLCKIGSWCAVVNICLSLYPNCQWLWQSLPDNKYKGRW